MQFNYSTELRDHTCFFFVTTHWKLEDDDEKEEEEELSVEGIFSIISVPSRAHRRTDVFVVCFSVVNTSSFDILE